MNDRETLKIDIKNLKCAYNKIKEALDCLIDVEDFKDQKYGELYDIAENINDIRIECEKYLEIMEGY